MNSKYKIGDKAYFQPNLRLIDARTNTTNPAVAAPCEISGVTFSASKVFYDIEVIYVEQDLTLRLPFQRVMSDFICDGEGA